MDKLVIIKLDKSNPLIKDLKRKSKLAKKLIKIQNELGCKIYVQL